MEYELRRIQRRLEALEQDESYWRGAIQGIAFTGSRDYAEERHGWVQQERERLEARLRQLLEWGAGDV